MIRRDFIKTIGLAGAAFSSMPSFTLNLEGTEKVKIGFIGWQDQSQHKGE